MMIRYITPYSTERNKLGYPNIGGIYNKCISELPDDCFVCIRDGDTMFLTPDWGHHIKEIIDENKDFDLITCVTNRVGLNTHTCGEYFFNCTDISEHIDHCKTRRTAFKNEVTKSNIAPGYFMIFHKSLWKKVGGFKENSITFDKIFSNKVLNSGGKIGIATGLYIFHLYRWGQENPEKSIKHLTKKA